ncbi:hypothetical protein LEP1GSC036_4113 [Leptospira weilii str. 2006001853]|uniref:Uncharacterized protein n=2 Tax=Leptospira weilii TaxID=28184 RepID=A0A828Z2X4_9LEPT|nr:hypothetical protein LEP1GSC036_4113 [Leptospira weilii str. 2006001853]EMM72052.1 hypothetical protein LEP1GSC038_3661 [Leptospira weilii str. 2006001855]
MNNCNSLSIFIDGIFFGNTKFSLTPVQKKQHNRCRIMNRKIF